MRKKWFAFGCLTSILVLIIIIFFIGHSISKLGKQKAVKVLPGSYLHLRLSGRIVDYKEIKDDLFMIDDDVYSAHEIIEKIDKAAKDDKIKGIILEPEWIRCGFATTNEIIAALEDFKTGGKQVIAYLDMVTNRDYFLASAAHEIYLNPSASAGILLTGIGSNILFYKDLLDKLGIEMQVIHAGKYKGAGEPYTRNQISKPFRESIDKLFSDIYENMLAEIANRREITTAQIKDIYEIRDELFINRETALKYKLVDELSFKEDLLAKFGIDNDNLLSLEDYKTRTVPLSFQENIAVLYAQGMITRARSGFEQKISAPRITKLLDKLQKDDKVKALVIRVNSPGGSALESEIILAKIREFKKQKPVVISMGNVAASGGYYISCVSDHIFADPFTITGSIGVVGMIPNINKLGDKVGIHPNEIRKGKFSNIFDPWVKPDPEQFSALKKGIEETYMEFKSRVSEGRDMSLNEVEKLAQGRIWSCRDAGENDLIDETGNLEDAIIKAAELAGITAFARTYYPKQKSFLELLLKERFNLDIISKVLNNDLQKDLGFDKAADFYKNIKNEPVQAIIPVQIENY